MPTGAAALGGAVDIIVDGELPRSFTGRATTALSGGQFVVCGTVGSNVVGSCMDLYNPGSITVGLIADSDYINGIAMHNAGSNSNVSVATRGTYIATAGDIVSGGNAVIAGSDTVQFVFGDPAISSDKSHMSGTHCGRAITAADSGTNHFCLVDFKF